MHVSSAYTALLVQEGEWEEFYTMPTEKGSTKCEKQYYLTVTLAGYGVIACVAMESGCSQTQRPADLILWHQRLVEFGVGDRATEEWLASKVWLVRVAFYNVRPARCNAACTSFCTYARHAASLSRACASTLQHAKPMRK